MIPSGYRINPIKTYSVNGSDGVATFYANAQSSVGDFPGSDTVYYITVNVLLIPITQTVTFDGNGGTVTPSTYQYVYGGKYGKFPVNPYYPGKRFLGWFTESIGGVEVTSTSSVTADETRTLYAHWEQGIRIPWTTCTFS
jgi:uncharacterized repeat protein (TIGR02543 family)